MDNKDTLLEKISKKNKININKEFDINKHINENDILFLINYLLLTFIIIIYIVIVAKKEKIKK